MKKNTIVTIIILLLVFLGYAFYLLMNPSVPRETSPAPTVVTQAPFIPSQNYTNVLAIDFNDDAHFSQNEILYGHDIVLALHTGEADVHSDDVISSVELLKSLDIDNNGRIDAVDPSFQRLEVIRLTGGGIRKEINSAFKAGIRAVIFEKNPNTPDVVGRAILADSTQRQIHIVSIEIKYLK